MTTRRFKPKPDTALKGATSMTPPPQTLRPAAAPERPLADRRDFLIQELKRQLEEQHVALTNRIIGLSEALARKDQENGDLRKQIAELSKLDGMMKPTADERGAKSAAA